MKATSRNGRVSAANHGTDVVFSKTHRPLSHYGHDNGPCLLDEVARLLVVLSKVNKMEKTAKANVLAAQVKHHRLQHQARDVLDDIVFKGRAAGMTFRELSKVLGMSRSSVHAIVQRVAIQDAARNEAGT